MRIQLLALAALCLPACAGSSPEESVPMTDPKPVTAAEALLAEGDQTFNSREYAEAAGIYERAAEAAERDDEPSTLVEALSQVARSWSIQQEDAKGRPWLDRAASLASPEHPGGWSRFLIVRGVFEREAGEKARATQTFIAAYDYCMKHDLHRRAINAAHMVALAAEPEVQIAWAHKGIAAAEKGGETGWLAVLWNNLGWTLDGLERYDEALEALEHARTYHWKGKNELSKLIADNGVGHAYRMVGRLDEARTWVTKSLAWAQRLFAEDPDNKHHAEWVGMTHQELGEIEAAEGNKEQGLSHLETAREFLVRAGAEKWGGDWLDKLDTRISALRQ